MSNVDLFKQCVDYTMLADGLSCTYEGNQWLKSDNAHIIQKKHMYGSVLWTSIYELDNAQSIPKNSHCVISFHYLGGIVLMPLARVESA